jgi:hypothetical protein
MILIQPVYSVKSSFDFGSRFIYSRSFEQDIVQLFKRISILAQITVITFFNNFGDVGLQGYLLYYLKATLHYEKTQYAYFVIIIGSIGAVSQLLLKILIGILPWRARAPMHRVIY